MKLSAAGHSPGKASGTCPSSSHLVCPCRLSLQPLLWRPRSTPLLISPHLLSANQRGCNLQRMLMGSTASPCDSEKEQACSEVSGRIGGEPTPLQVAGVQTGSREEQRGGHRSGS